LGAVWCGPGVWGESPILDLPFSAVAMELAKLWKKCTPSRGKPIFAMNYIIINYKTM